MTTMARATQSETEHISVRPARRPFTGPARWSLVNPVSWLEIVLVVAVSIGLVYYADRLDPVRPAAGLPGFYGWYDQGEYLNILHVLAGGHLPSASQFSYGLGYPLIGLPFYLIGLTRDPFLVPDTIMAAVAMAAVYVFAVRVIGRAGGVAVVSLLLLATPMVELTSVPWTSIVTVVGLAVSLAIATSARLTLGRAAVIGIMAGAVFAARYADVAIIIAVGVWCVFSTRRGSRVVTAIAMGVPAAIIAGLVALSQKIILGSPFTTPYASHLQSDGASDQSLAHYSVSAMVVHFVETFVTGRNGDQLVPASPLLAISPFLILAPVGMVLVLRRRRAVRSLHIVLIVGSLILTGVYLSFVAGGGEALPYHNFRYWLPYYPYWTVLAVLAVVEGYRWLRQRQRTSEFQTESE